MRFDELDLKILVALQANGRVTKLHLAEQIGLSPSPCWERLRRLEEAGLIRGYHADVAIERVTKMSVVFVEVTLRAHEAPDFIRFERAVLDVPEVVECHATAGGFDYLLKVVTASVERYQNLIDELLTADIGIHRYFTYIVTQPIKRFTGYPLQRLIEASEGTRTSRGADPGRRPPRER
ncbi:MAG: Lrp/AsnC family transcriptional regulator [Vicinamibacteria bacterium]